MDFIYMYTEGCSHSSRPDPVPLQDTVGSPATQRGMASRLWEII